MTTRSRSPVTDHDPRIDELAQKLGDASARALQEPIHREAIVRLVSDGYALEDAVLKVVHGLIRQDRDVANEFFACFLLDLTKLGKFSMSSSSRLRRFLDTGDLMGSVICDLLPDISSLAFESRSQFVHLLGQRMGWKAADNARKLTTRSRREDKRVFVEPEELEREDAAEAVTERLIRNEERDRLYLVLLRLPERDRQLLALRLKGMEIQEIADELDLNYDAARKAISRALAKARDLMGGDDRRKRPPASDPDDPI
jgi:RNA polymerase sigma factor (sigma-70 family)